MYKAVGGRDVNRPLSCDDDDDDDDDDDEVGPLSEHAAPNFTVEFATASPNIRLQIKESALGEPFYLQLELCCLQLSFFCKESQLHITVSRKLPAVS